jgi:hypothetical protein
MGLHIYLGLCMRPNLTANRAKPEFTFSGPTDSNPQARGATTG